MAQVRLQDGKPILEGGKVGVAEACCCGGDCVCPEGCVENLQISLGGNPACFGGFYSDFIECFNGGISASMYCDGGTWIVSVSVCCFENGGLCFASYEAVLECEADNLPPAGAVALIETGFFEEGGGCPPLPPTVTIIK